MTLVREGDAQNVSILNSALEATIRTFFFWLHSGGYQIQSRVVEVKSFFSFRG